MNQDKFNKDYNQRLRQIDVGDGDSLWKDIENELDFNETWDNISAQLDIVQPERTIFIGLPSLKVMLAAAAVVLLLIIPANFINNNIRLNNSTIHSPSVAKIEEIVSGNDVDEATDGSFQNITGETTREAALKKQPYQHEIAVLPEERSMLESHALHPPNQEEVSKMELIPMQEWDMSMINVKNLKPVLVYTEFRPEEKEANGSTISLFHLAEAGLVFGYKNTWLWNSETINGLNPHSLRNTLPTFQNDFGFTSTIVFRDKHQFGVQLLWQSGVGQNYKQFINASYVERNINLNYLRLQGFYELESKRLPGQFLLGGYFARLNFAEEYRDGTRINLRDNFRNSDFGLLVGYQFEINFRNRIILKPRVMTSYNLMNIARENELTPAGMNRTRNFATGFDLAIYYRLSR